MFKIRLVDTNSSEVTLTLTNKIADVKIHHRDYKAFLTDDIITALTDDCKSVGIEYLISNYVLYYKDINIRLIDVLYANYKKEAEHNAELTKRCKQLDISLFKRNAELAKLKAEPYEPHLALPNHILTRAPTPAAAELERKLTDAKSTIYQLQRDYRKLAYKLSKKPSVDELEISDIHNELLVRNKQIEQLLQIIKSETSCLDADLYIDMIKLSIEF